MLPLGVLARIHHVAMAQHNVVYVIPEEGQETVGSPNSPPIQDVQDVASDAIHDTRQVSAGQIQDGNSIPTV